VIPPEYRKALGLCEGDTLILRLADGQIQLFTPAEGVKRAQELVSRAIPAERSLVDELIAERRAEAARE
jgi:bifunctional DNA-binding transcriptional regulator/antitoxin component of YhaV-PrlF toxin-antitoxin module